MGKISTKKAQVWSLDLTFSLIIFMTALFAVVFAWNYISATTLETEEMQKLQLKALTLSDSMIRTPGIPLNWNESTVEVIGLAQEENVLNITKVQCFVNMSVTDYDRLKGLLDIGFYDLYLEVVDLNGTVYKNTTTPIDPASPLVVPIERYAMYNDRIVKVKFVIWD
jgi:uncharacterized membrane protein